MNFVEESSNQESTKVSLYDSFIGDERYRRASWINVTVMSFHALTGYSAVMAFSNTIFKEAQNPDGSGISPRVGTYLVGLCNLLAAMCGIYTVRSFGRRTVLLFGHTSIAILHFLIAIATITEHSNL